MTKKRVLGILGSTRTNSVNEQILKAIRVLCAHDISIELYTEISDLPHFNPDVSDDQLHERVRHLRREIAAADGIIICTPEYIFSVPSILKNALEWTVSTTVFTDKPVAFIVASSAGEKAYESLDLIMTTLGARVGEFSKLLLQGARSKFNADHGPDEKTFSELRRLTTSFIQSMEQLPR